MRSHNRFVSLRYTKTGLIHHVFSVRKHILSSYTYPEKWKNQYFLESIELELSIRPDRCICQNCWDCLSSGKKNPESVSPRWKYITSRSALYRHKQFANFSACSEPEVFLNGTFTSTKYDDFEGTINAHDKLCLECYRHSLIISKTKKEIPFPLIPILMLSFSNSKHYPVYHSISMTCAN